MQIFPSLPCSTPPELFKKIENVSRVFRISPIFRPRTLSQQLKVTLRASHVFTTAQCDPRRVPRSSSSSKSKSTHLQLSSATAPAPAPNPIPDQLSASSNLQIGSNSQMPGPAAANRTGTNVGPNYHTKSAGAAPRTLLLIILIF